MTKPSPTPRSTPSPTQRAISTDQAPAAVGPYSQGVVTDQLVFVSGQLPIDPATGTMPPDIAEQARQSITNIEVILGSEHLGLPDVVKTTALLTDLEDFAAVNQIYDTAFNGPVKPARAAYQVTRLPLGSSIEIEAIAIRAPIRQAHSHADGQPAIDVRDGEPHA